MSFSTFSGRTLVSHDNLYEDTDGGSIEQGGEPAARGKKLP